MRRLLSIVLICSLPVGAAAQTSALPASSPAPAQAAPAAAPSGYDKLWGAFTEWYRDDGNPVVQRVQLSGRLHYDYSALGAGGRHHDEGNLRRLRVGPRVTLFRTLTLHSEVELDPQRADPLYVRFTDFYVQWARSGRLALTLGKQSVPFTLDGSTSSREVLTIDRSNVANNIWFPQEYIPGVSVSGRRAPWLYRAGVYSAGRATREFGEMNGGAFVLGVLGYDLSTTLGVKEALVTTNYVYQRPNANNTFTRQLEHVGSLNFRFETATWGARTDVSGAAGYLGQSDLWGLQLMPFVNATGKLQFVARYTFLDSEGPNGIRLALYETRLVPGRGDQYKELYLGANYYFYGHRLKLQSGVQFADMRDRADDGGAYSGTAWTSALRVGW